MLCAACFQSGRWYQELAGTAAAHPKADPGNELVVASFRGAPMPAQQPLLSDIPSKEEHIPGGPGGDIITPLNVRDPSALVMGPGASRLECLPAPVAVPEEAPAKKKARKLKEGRLLELLKKTDEKSDSPKSF